VTFFVAFLLGNNMGKVLHLQLHMVVFYRENISVAQSANDEVRDTHLCFVVFHTGAYLYDNLNIVVY